MNIFKNVTKKNWAIGSGILIIGLATGLGIAFMTLPNKIVAVNNTKIITAQQKQIEKLKNNLLSQPNRIIANHIGLLGKKNANLEKSLKSAGERIKKLLPRG